MKDNVDNKALKLIEYFMLQNYKYKKYIKT